MLNNLFSAIYTGDVTVKVYIICTLVSLVCGAAIAVSSAFRSRLSKSFRVAIFLIPAVVQTVIMLVNGSIGTGLAVMSAFSLIRFRSAPGSAKEIVAIFAAMAAGLASATGYVFLALILTAIVAIVMIEAEFIHIREEDDLRRILRITVPESLSYAHEFDDLFKKYTTESLLTTSKTTNMGSLYKLTYKIRLKNESDVQAFIDELRVRNGNLEISVSLPEIEHNEL